MSLPTRLRQLVRRQPLPRRLAGGLAALVVVFGLLFVVFATSALRLNAAQDYVTGPVFQASIESRLRFEALLDQQTGVRGYALAGRQDLLEPYRSGQRVERGAAERIRRLVGDQPALIAASERVDRLALQWRTTYAEPLIRDLAAGRAGAVTPARLEAGNRVFDGIRVADARYANLVEQSRAAAVADLDTAERWVVAALAAGAVVGVLAALAAAVALRRWVTEPVRTLAAETATVRTGRLDHEVRGSGPPEFVALARDVDLMRLSLVEQIVEIDRAGRAVETARAALEAQARDLERSNRDLEQFAYVASHDLQEPLRKVASFCQMLERRYAGQLDERADQYIAFAVDGAKRMQALINDLLAFSRVGRVATPNTDVDLERCLEQALRNLDTRIADAGARVTHDPLPTVPGEAPLLTLLLQNIVGNGVKFHGAEPPRVHVSAHRTGEQWEFCCADNGIGIEQQYADRIFVIFQRLHPREEYEGTGIGLAMCKKIVEYHGGQIWLDAATTRGTTFRWTLPAHRPADLTRETAV